MMEEGKALRLQIHATKMKIMRTGKPTINKEIKIGGYNLEVVKTLRVLAAR